MTVTSVISYLGSGLAAARPSNPGIPSDTLGFYYSTDSTSLSFWNGASWSNVSGSLSGAPFSYTLAWGAGSVAQVGTIEIEGSFQANAHILGVVFDNGVGGGTIDGDFQINTTSITGLAAVVNNGAGTTTATGLNAAAAGDTLRVILSSNTGTITDGGFFTPFGTYD